MATAHLLASSADLPAPVLTAYLDIIPAEAGNPQNKKEYLPWLKKQAKAMAEDVRPRERRVFEQQVEKLEIFLRDHTPPGKGLLVIAGPTTWEFATLQQHVENELHWGAPELTQLEWNLRETTPVCVVVADQSGARIFRNSTNELALLAEKKFEIDISQWKRKDLGHFSRQGIKKTHGSQRDTFERRRDAQFERLLSETAGLAEDICEKQKLVALFLICSERLQKPITEAFSKDFRRRVIAIPEDLHGLTIPELRGTIEPRIAEWQSEYESKLVNRLLTDERKAVAGLGETLAQLQRGRIRRILVARGLNGGLRQCIDCGWTDNSADPACSICGRRERYPVDLRHILPELARNGAAEIQIVSDDAEKELMRAGGIGGWLRDRTREQLR